MKYLCLIYDDEKKIASMSKTEIDQFMGEYMAFSESLRASGHYLGGNALQPVSAATSIRSRNGKISTTDGPFAETKDLNDALAVAARIPSARIGTIEVRPIRVF